MTAFFLETHVARSFHQCKAIPACQHKFFGKIGGVCRNEMDVTLLINDLKIFSRVHALVDDEGKILLAALRELESFILEFGKGFAFVERQKRMIIDGEDFYLDLLFYHRTLKRLVAVELKLGKFQARDKGQMELYLKWLDRYERQEGENAPVGLILCAAGSREQVELLEMHKDGIVVAEYWTELPPKEELEQKIRDLLLEARERLTRRQLRLPS